MSNIFVTQKELDAAITNRDPESIRETMKQLVVAKIKTYFRDKGAIYTATSDCVNVNLSDKSFNDFAKDIGFGSKTEINRGVGNQGNKKRVSKKSKGTR